MPPSESVVFIEVGVVTGIVGTDEIGLRTLFVEAAADDLFDLTLVKVDTGPELCHGLGSQWCLLSALMAAATIIAKNDPVTDHICCTK